MFSCRLLPEVRAFLLLLLLGCGLVPTHAAAQQASLPRIDGAVEVNGRCDESVWATTDPLPMTMHQPTFRGALTVRTEVWVVHSDEAIYVSGRLYYDPEGIRAHSIASDEWNGGDWAYADDGAQINERWNGIWSIATRRTSHGWTAEMRIPLSTLGRRAVGGTETIGLILFRSVARKNEIQTFVARDQGFDAHMARLRIRTAINKHLSGDTLVQYSSVTDRVTANVRLRYHLKAGTDLWLVYNERLNTDRHCSAPVLPRTGRRTLPVKATATFGV